MPLPILVMSLLRRLQILFVLSLIAGFGIGLHALTVAIPSEQAQASDEGARHIFLTLSDGRETVSPGDSLLYGITVRSDSTRVELVDVTLTLPPFANLVEASDGGRREGDTIVWRNFPLDPVVARKLYVDVSVDPYAPVGGAMTAEAVCDSEHAVDTTRLIGPRMVLMPPDLFVRVSDGKDFAGPDEELRYVLTVENRSDVDRTFELRATLPSALVFLAATGQFQEQNGSLRWMDQLIRAGDVRTYEVMAAVNHSAIDFANITFKASVDGIPAGDVTIVQRQPVIEGFSITVSDAQEETTPASSVTYQIRLRNEDDILATGLTVSAAIPTFTEFMEASNGGVWTGNNVRWENLTVSPHGERVLTVVAHVRTDAPEGASLRMTAETQGLVAVDLTTIVAGNPQNTISGRAPATLQKTADRSEVRPGDTVTYTVSLRNNTDRPFRSVRVEDRLDTQYLTILGAERGQMEGGRLVWVLPELAPGQVWTVRYTAEVSAATPSGISLDNVVTASGEGMETLSLTERVFTERLGVVSGLPPTGAAFDAIFLALTGLAGLGQTFLLKRRVIA